MPTDKTYLYVSPTFKSPPATCWLWLFAVSWQGRWWELMSSELPMVRATETQQCGSIKQWDEKCKEVQSTLLILRGATEFMSNLHCFYIRASPRLMSVLVSCGFGKQSKRGFCLRVMCLRQPVKTVCRSWSFVLPAGLFFLNTSCARSRFHPDDLQLFCPDCQVILFQKSAQVAVSFHVDCQKCQIYYGT